MSDTIDTEVAIVGSGFCGIAMGIRLREAGVPFQILEKADGVGGPRRLSPPGASTRRSGEVYFAERVLD